MTLEATGFLLASNMMNCWVGHIDRTEGRGKKNRFPALAWLSWSERKKKKKETERQREEWREREREERERGRDEDVIYEYIWRYMKIYEDIWRYLKIHEDIWRYMKISWKYMKISWKYMKIPWRYHEDIMTIWWRDGDEDMVQMMVMMMIIMIWCDMIWSDLIWYDMMWCDVMWYDLMWYDMICIWYDLIWYDMIWYDAIWWRYGEDDENDEENIYDEYFHMNFWEEPFAGAFWKKSCVVVGYVYSEIVSFYFPSWDPSSMLTHCAESAVSKIFESLQFYRLFKKCCGNLRGNLAVSYIAWRREDCWRLFWRPLERSFHKFQTIFFAEPKTWME